jgi:hypothetical protein
MQVRGTPDRQSLDASLENDGTNPYAAPSEQAVALIRPRRKASVYSRIALVWLCVVSFIYCGFFLWLTSSPPDRKFAWVYLSNAPLLLLWIVSLVLGGRAYVYGFLTLALQFAIMVGMLQIRGINAIAVLGAYGFTLAAFVIPAALSWKSGRNFHGN